MEFCNENKLKIYIIGICGIGTSAVALYLNENGFNVSGSDIVIDNYKNIFSEKGIVLFQGHNEKNVAGSDIVIYNSAINKDNVEFEYALKNNIPIYSRAEVLSMIEKKFPISVGVCGAHGKTTTTSLISHILRAASKPFTAFIGGKDKKLSNYCSFGNELFLSEICEYKKNIDFFSPSIGVILNIDNDHLDCYDGIDDVIETFADFSERSDYCIVNASDKKINDEFKKNLTFGLAEGNFSAKDIIIDNTDKTTCFTALKNGEEYLKLKVKLLGEHNVMNVLAAVAVSDRLGIDKKYIIEGTESFCGIERRDEFLGEYSGVKIIADYAHHPKEIEKFLESYNFDYDKTIVLFQPHTYSRTKILLNDFVKTLSQVKNLWIYKTYPAREAYDEDGSAKRLAEQILSSKYFDNFDSVLSEIEAVSNKCSTLLIIGAGDVYDKIKKHIEKMRN